MKTKEFSQLIYFNENECTQIYREGIAVNFESLQNHTDLIEQAGYWRPFEMGLGQRSLRPYSIRKKGREACKDQVSNQRHGKTHS